MSNSVKTTLEAIEIMLKNADKGPSGFWVDDHEGCGNPLIFPEFDNGLKSGAYVCLEHRVCPWDRSVLFGDSHGCHLNSGCYHRCAIREAKYLSSEMIKRILKSFSSNLKAGKYECSNKEIIVPPLILDDEIKYIEKRKKSESEKKEREADRERSERMKKASKLLSRFPKGKDNNDEIRAHIINNYGVPTWANTYDFGMIDFHSDGMKDLAGGEKFSYDEYLEVQFKSSPSKRNSFINCFFNMPSEFKGCIERISGDNILFKRIFVTGMYLDDCSFFDGKEDHVWMSREGFEGFNIGDCVEFFAEVYRYVKTSNGKAIDYSLRNPKGIKKIEPYKLPTDQELMEQKIASIICESCYLREYCINGGNWCMRDPQEVKALKKDMMKVLLEKEKLQSNLQ